MTRCSWWPIVCASFMILACVPCAVAEDAAPPDPAEAAAPAAPPPPVKAMAPDEATQERCNKELRSIYKAEFASKKPEERIALARTLLDLAEKPGDAASRYAMLLAAMDLAAKAADLAVLMEATDALASNFRVDAEVERLRALTALAPAITTVEESAAAISAASAIVDTAIQRDDYPLAMKAAIIAAQIARRSRDSGLLAQIKTQGEQVKALAEAWTQLGEVQDPLGGISDDGHAKLGRFYSLCKGDWVTALPHLAAGNDQPLRQAAAAEIASTEASALSIVAESWFNLAAKERAQAKQQMLAHSADLYRQALPGLAAMDQARVDKRLAELDRLLAGSTRGASRRPPGAILYFSFERDGFAQDGNMPVALDSSGHGLRARINGAKPAIGAYGSALEFGPGPNSLDCGAVKDLALTGSLSLSMWLKPSALGARRNPFFKSYGGEAAITLEVTGTLSFYYGPNGVDVAPYQGFNTTTPLPAQAWSHIVLVRDLGPAMRLAWYINGVKNHEVAAQYATVKPSNASLKIGIGYTGIPYLGLIDEVGVWSRALSDAEIKALHGASSAGR